MNIEEDLTCKCCNEIFKNPITLNCCGDNICKHHIEQLITSSTSNQFACPLCNQDNINQNLNVNKFMQKMVENELYKFKISSKYKKTLEQLKWEIQKIEAIVKDPKNFIYEEISELKRNVDLDREKLKSEIDDLANDLIQQLEKYEKKFKEEYKVNINLDHYNEIIASSKNQLSEFEKCLSLFSTSKKERNEKCYQSEKTINFVQSMIKETKFKLFANTFLTYIPTQKSQGDLFGKLIVKNKKEFLGTVKKEYKENNGCIVSLAVLPNGDLVSEGENHSIKVWNTNDGKVKRILAGHTKWVRGYVLIENNNLVTASEDSTIKIWDLYEETLIRNLTEHSSAVKSIILLSNGDLASASADKTIKIWDLNSGTVKKTLIGHSNEVWILLLLKNGDLASGSSDNTIKIWDVGSGIIKKTLTGHTNFVYALKSLENGNIVSGSEDNTIKIWDVETGTLIRTLAGHTKYVFALKVLDNGDLVSGSEDGTIIIWDVGKGMVKKSLMNKGPVYALELLENGDLVSGGRDRTIKIWE